MYYLIDEFKFNDKVYTSMKLNANSYLCTHSRKSMFKINHHFHYAIVTAGDTWFNGL